MQENSYPMEIDVITAASQKEESATLLDVREPMELEICKVQGSLDIPMNEIPARLDQLPKEGALLVMCHHGTRSAHVTAFLRQNGFENAVNVSGGIEAWAQAVDTELTRY